MAYFFDLSLRQLVPPIKEALLQDVACAAILHLEDLYHASIDCPADPPNSFADDRLLEEVQEHTREIDAKIAIPLESAHTLYIRGYPLGV